MRTGPRQRLLGFGAWLRVGIVSGIMVALLRTGGHRAPPRRLSRSIRARESLPAALHQGIIRGACQVMLTGANHLFGLWLSFFREHSPRSSQFSRCPRSLVLNGRALCDRAPSCYVVKIFRQQDVAAQARWRIQFPVAARASDALAM